MSTRAESSPPVVVVTAIAVGDPEAVSLTTAAVRRQVYESARVVLVGGDAEARRRATDDGMAWAPSLAALIGSVGPDVSHLWVLRAGALPRPDALSALVEEGERNGAGIAGSKLLRRDAPERLIAVGLATDVFDVPYVGLDVDEIDAGQYDVVRDVAAVPDISILIRRDLARGVSGPDPKLAPLPAAVDLAQRARLRGARVIVVPSSEVLIDPEATRASAWREEAGRIRAMTKVYGFLTLVWALPLTFLIGLVEAIVAPFLGRFTLFSWLAAWVWNLFHLPGTVRERWAARRGRVADDAELFRFQLRGSARLRSLGGEIGRKMRDRLGLEEGFRFAELSRDLRSPAFVTGVLAAGFAFFATRSIWGGQLPASGYSLPLPASGAEAVRAYSGGWNPAGMGSPEPLRPIIGFAGLLQSVVFDRPGATLSLMIVATALLALWGMARLMRSFGIETTAAFLGASVLLAGPAARALTDDTGLASWLGLGVLPWALRVVLAPWPPRLMARIGRVAAAAWTIGLLGVLSPALVVVPLGAVVLWAVLNPLRGALWRAAAVALLGTGLAVPLLLPWVAHADLERFLQLGVAFWEPGWLLLVGLGAAILAVVVAGPGQHAAAGVWGGLLVAGGAALARSGDLGPGREVEHLGLVVASLGSAVVVAAALDALRRIDVVVGWRRLVAAVGSVAALAMVASTFLAAFPGRIGLPGDVLDDQIGFTAAAEGDPASSRILLIGPAETLPGDARTVLGAGYRVVSAPQPALWEAWLPAPTAADTALEATLVDLIEGESTRAGEALAPFGIRWVVSTGDTPLEEVFEGQLDLVPLGTGGGLALTFDGEAPVRAWTDDGQAWRRTSWGYEGPAEAGRVTLAESANTRWGPEWSQEGWQNQVSATEGRARFAAIPGRRTEALVAAGALLVLLVVSWLGRRAV